MKIGIGNDHAAVKLKEEVIRYLTEKGFECVDYGSKDMSGKDDYPLCKRRFQRYNGGMP